MKWQFLFLLSAVKHKSPWLFHQYWFVEPPQLLFSLLLCCLLSFRPACLGFTLWTGSAQCQTVGLLMCTHFPPYNVHFLQSETWSWFTVIPHWHHLSPLRHFHGYNSGTITGTTMKLTKMWECFIESVQFSSHCYWVCFLERIIEILPFNMPTLKALWHIFTL